MLLVTAQITIQLGTINDFENLDPSFVLVKPKYMQPPE